MSNGGKNIGKKKRKLEKDKCKARGKNKYGELYSSARVPKSLAVIMHFTARAMAKLIIWSFIVVWDASTCYCIQATKDM